MRRLDEVAQVLDAWQDAERKVERNAPGSINWTAAVAEAKRLHAEYLRLVGAGNDYPHVERGGHPPASAWSSAS